MIYVVLAVALIGLYLAWKANKKQKSLNDRITELNGRIYQTRREMLESQEETKQALTKLRFDALKAQGQLQVTSDMTVGEVLMTHPMAGQVLASFHVGGCSSCATDDEQRLDLALASSGQSVEPVLVALNNLITREHETGAVSENLLKTPNVELSF